MFYDGLKVSILSSILNLFNSNVGAGFVFYFPEVRVVLLCLLLQGEGERLDLLLGDGEVECPDGGG